jgi:hypothetical protein
LIEFDAFTAAQRAFRHPPQSTDLAPARLFARRLGFELWYNPVGLSGGDQEAEPEAMPIEFLELTSCKSGNLLKDVGAYRAGGLRGNRVSDNGDMISPAILIP